MSEIWTAVKEIECERDGEPMIIFEVKDEVTGETHEERRYKAAIPLMLALGGYPDVMGIVMQIEELPWRFRKMGEHIYLDGPSVEVSEQIDEESEGSE